MPRSEALERTPSLPEEVARVLREEIDSGAIPPGNRLPTEQELSERFDVSRPVIREAVSRLKYDGLVTSHQGRGVFVSPPATRHAFRIELKALEDRRDLSDILELRLTLEAEAAALAALRRKRAHLSAMESAIADLEDAVRSKTQGDDADAAFHQSVVEASDNSYFRQFAEFLKGRIDGSIRAARYDYLQNEARARLDIDEHREIFEAIQRRDPSAARDATLQHLLKGARDLKLDKRMFDHAAKIRR